jgi:hypothetical protein
MYMVGHKHIEIKLAVAFAHHLFQVVEKIKKVILVKEDRLAIVAALH